MYKRDLSNSEAEKVVSLVEKILTQPKLPYGYRLSELEQYSRIDVAHAFKIVIAQIYENLGKHARDNKDVNALVTAMDGSLVRIATSGIPDEELDKVGDENDLLVLAGLAVDWSLVVFDDKTDTEIASLRSERLAFADMEIPSSFANYCYALIEADEANYWERVYTHIGLDMPRLIEEHSPKNVRELNSNSSCLSLVLCLITLFSLLVSL